MPFDNIAYCTNVSACLSVSPLAYLNKSSAVAETGDRLATIDVGRKVGLMFPLFWGAESPSNTMWSWPTPTSIRSGILIHPAVWPQYTNVTDRQTGQTGQRANRYF